VVIAVHRYWFQQLIWSDLAGPFLVKFGIESKFSCPTTSTSRFKHHIVQALRDMREVCEAATAGGVQVKAKL
jgi:carnitine O-acetyltransferase